MKAQPKQTILNSAVRLFSEQGYAGTSIADIASASAVQKSLIYYYFQSKEAILEKILLEKLQTLLEQKQSYLDQTQENDSKIRLSVRAGLQFLFENYDIIIIFISEIILNKVKSQKIQARIQELLALAEHAELNATEKGRDEFLFFLVYFCLPPLISILLTGKALQQELQISRPAFIRYFRESANISLSSPYFHLTEPEREFVLDELETFANSILDRDGQPQTP